MALIPFAKASELQTLTPCDDDLADLVVKLVSGGIRAAVQWDVDFAAGRTYTLQGPPGVSPLIAHTQPGPRLVSQRTPAVVLPAMNVTAVSAVTVDGAALTSDQWVFTTSGIVYLRVRPAEVVSITYDAGYVRGPEDMAPGVFREVCLDYATARVSNPEGLKAYTMGGTSETFAAPPPMVEDPRLDPYRVGVL